MFGRTLIFVGLLTTSFVVVQATLFSIGEREKNDMLLLIEHVWVGPKNDTVPVEQKSFLAPYIKRITRVAVDEYRGGGKVVMTSGGPGYKYVTLLLTGMKGEGIFYNVYVYGF